MPKKSCLVAMVLTSACVIGVQGVYAAGGYTAGAAKDAGASAVAVGENAEAKGMASVAVGESSKAGEDFSLALGSEAKAEGGVMNIAIGFGAHAKDLGAVAIGGQTEATDLLSVAIGATAKVKPGAKYKGDVSIAIGPSAEVRGGEHSVAIGHASNVVDTGHATAVGVGTYVGALPVAVDTPLVINDGAQGQTVITKKEDGSYTVQRTRDNAAKLKERNGEAYGASVYGHRSTAHGMGALAAGMYSTAVGDSSVALGSSTTTLGDKTVAVGSRATAHKERATSLGYYSDAKIAGSVAIGYYATADRDKDVKGYAWNADITDEATFNQFLAETNSQKETWQSTEAAVSVGSKNDKVTRQITNVAAGSEDTDAVNVAQLKYMAHELSKNTSGVSQDLESVKEAVYSLGDDVKTVGAQAAAVSALRPLPYVLGDKLSVAAGVGSYQGKKAMALGGFYYFNKDTLMSVGTSLGKHNMLQVGFSFRVGKYTTQPASVKNEEVGSIVQGLALENKALQKQLEAQQKQIDRLMKKVGM